MEVEAFTSPLPPSLCFFQAPPNLFHLGGGKLLRIPHLKQSGLHLAPPHPMHACPRRETVGEFCGVSGLEGWMTRTILVS